MAVNDVDVDDNFLTFDRQLNSVTLVSHEDHEVMVPDRTQMGKCHYPSALAGAI